MSAATRKGWMLQVFRKLVQSSALGFVIYAALSAHWRNHKVAHNSSRITGMMTNETWGELYAGNERLLSFFGEPLEVSEGFLGGPWAATFAGIPLVDPLAVLSLLASGDGAPLAMVLGALLPLGIALVFGRLFCSFLCPARLLFEVGNATRRGMIWLGLDLPSLEIPRIGLWVAAGSVLFAASAGAGIWHFVLPYLSVGAAIHGYVLGGALMGTAWWMAALLLVDVFVAPGQFCHSICPTGAVLEQVSRFALLRIRRDKPPCPTTCDLCQRACPYGLFPGRQTHTPACDSCGRCVVACPQNKLAHKMRLPKATLPVLLALLVAGPAFAHHNKGLPHYGYFENYPQVPTEEFIDEQGRWEVGAVLFNFQGLRRTTSTTPDDVKIFAYVYDLETDRGYKGPLSLHLMREGETVAVFDRLEPDQEGVYLTRQTMPASGEYQLVFEIPADGLVHEVPLDIEVDLAADQVNWALLAGAGGGLGLIFLLATASRKARRVPRAPKAAEA